MISFSFFRQHWKITRKFRLNFEYIWKYNGNGAFATKEQCSIFHIIFKYMIFQRHQKALLWSKRLNAQVNVSSRAKARSSIFISIHRGQKFHSSARYYEWNLEGRVILPKALILQDEYFGKNYSRKSYYICSYCIHFERTNACVCRTSENCKSLILQDQCNIEIFLSPDSYFAIVVWQWDKYQILMYWLKCKS